MSTFSDNYSTAVATLGTLGDSRDGKQVLMCIPFYLVVPSTPGTAPVFNLGDKVPAGFKPRLVVALTDGLSASGGVGLTLAIGDAGSAARLMSAQDFDAAASFIGLDAAGYDYEYTADTQIIGTVNSSKTPVTGQHVFGFILGSPRKAT